MCSCVDMQIHAGRLGLEFDVRVSACQGFTKYYISTEFDAVSSGHFPRRTNCNPRLVLGSDLLTSVGASRGFAMDYLSTLMPVTRAFSLLEHGQTNRRD